VAGFRCRRLPEGRKAGSDFLIGGKGGILSPGLHFPKPERDRSTFGQCYRAIIRIARISGDSYCGFDRWAKTIKASLIFIEVLPVYVVYVH